MALRIFTEPQMGASYDELLAIASTAEDAGFDAFFRSDHYLRFGSGKPLPYTDAWVTLAGLARDTTRIRLGTLVTFRDPGVFAVMATQIDQMSGGRIDVGLGAGWNGAEHDAYGIAFPDLGGRYDRLEDQLAILHGVWRADPGEIFRFKGRTCSVELEADTLRPAAKPHPPIVLGGQGGPRSGRLVAAFADEFNTAFVPVPVMKAIHDRVRETCEKAGRDPGSIVWSVALTVICGADDAEVTRRAAAIGKQPGDMQGNALCGTPDRVLTRIGEYAAAGADRIYLQVLDIRDLDHVRYLGETVLPEAPGR